jgi:hypothetical protein
MGGAGGRGGRRACRAGFIGAQVGRLRVVEAEVSRWNPNKGRTEAQLLG